MKKALKIAGITLGSLLGIVLIAAVIVSNIVLSPKKLTRLVKKHAPEFVTCDLQLEMADLTLFKTFPNVGVEIDKVILVNPMQNAPSDTLADIGQVIVSTNLRKILKSDEIVVNKCVLKDARLNLFRDENGLTNYDVFVSDTMPKETVSKPFKYSIDVQGVQLKNVNLFYADSISKMTATLQQLNLNLKGDLKEKDINADLNLKASALALQMPKLAASTQNIGIAYKGSIQNYKQINGDVDLNTPDICLQSGEKYLNHDTVRLHLPLNLDLNNMAGSLRQAKIGLNNYLIDLDGSASYSQNRDITLDLAFATNDLIIEDVTGFLPEKAKTSLNSMTFSGKARLSEGQVKGILNDSLMPLIQVKVHTDKATVDIHSMPYPFTDVHLDALLNLNLNDKSSADVCQITAVMNKSHIRANGLVDNFTKKLAFNMDVEADMPLTDLKKFLPKNIKLDGQSDVKLKVNCGLKELLDALTKFQFNQANLKGNIAINRFAINMSDTILATAPRFQLAVTLPASRQINGRKGAYVAIDTRQLQAQVGKKINAELTDLKLNATADNIKGGLNGILANADLTVSALTADYDTVHLDTKQAHIVATTTPQSTKNLQAHVIFDSKTLTAYTGKAYHFTASDFDIDIVARQDKSKKDVLNQWNPTANFNLKNAEVHVAKTNNDFVIPTIDFLFNPEELNIRESAVRIGQSDMSLKGRITGINEWMEDHNQLVKGNLELSSQFLNIDEIMALTSGLGRSSDSTQIASEESDKEDNPFMVPETVDFTFDINSKSAIYGNFDLHDLGGQLTVKDGTLVLNQIGFTNKAAEMQLTAIYQSPRKNHLFLGMDFHLLDVQINDLISMIPVIDTLVPMLKTFDGNGEFHITAQTNLKSNYEPKISTLRAAADIEGQNLYVRDTASFTKTTNMLKISTNGEFKIDSLDVQLTVFRNEIDLYPFLISIGKYKAVASGRHNLDMSCNYHISVTDTPLPTRLGIDISGNMKNLKYSLAPCKYKNLYRPEKRSDTDKMVLELKQRIADALKANVKKSNP